MVTLTFNALRIANKLRLPLFTRKDKHGVTDKAHSKPDGSDWSPKMWIIAMMGEVGETVAALAQGDELEIGKEFADIQTYLDIAARRALDEEKRHRSVPFTEDHLAAMIQNLGAICESHKKFVRGDKESYEHSGDMQPHLIEMMRTCLVLMEEGVVHREWEAIAHPDGIDLGEYTILKFNEVSDRVNCHIKIVDGIVEGM